MLGNGDVTIVIKPTRRFAATHKEARGDFIRWKAFTQRGHRPQIISGGIIKINSLPDFQDIAIFGSISSDYQTIYNRSVDRVHVVFGRHPIVPNPPLD